jgi:hypothetical protein
VNVQKQKEVWKKLMPMLKYRDKFIVAGLDKSVDHAL